VALGCFLPAVAGPVSKRVVFETAGGCGIYGNSPLPCRSSSCPENEEQKKKKKKTRLPGPDDGSGGWWCRPRLSHAGGATPMVATMRARPGTGVSVNKKPGSGRGAGGRRCHFLPHFYRNEDRPNAYRARSVHILFGWSLNRVKSPPPPPPPPPEAVSDSV